MLSTPLWIQMIHGFLAGFTPAYTGLVLVNIRPRLSKVFITGLFYALLVLLFWSLQLPFQIRFLVLTAFLVLIIAFIWRLSIFRAIIVAVLGTMILALGEALLFPLYLKLVGIGIEQASKNNLLTLISALPQNILSFFLVFICLKFKLHLFDFHRFESDSSFNLTGKRLSLVLGLFVSMVVLLILQILCNVTIFTMKDYNIFPQEVVGIFSNIILILVCITAALLVAQILELTQKESQYIIQSSYVETFDELYTAIHSQRHDLANHLQVLYGFLQMGNLNEVRQYLEEMLGESVSSNKLIDSGSPGLSALLYIKSGVAMINEIDFRVDIQDKVDQIDISPYDLNRIIGNIINNAFDYVLKLDKENRIVHIEVKEVESFYLIEIANFGQIEEEIRKRIFEKGFSTKVGEHSGLGLYIVEDLVQKYGGLIEVISRDDRVVFSLRLPKKKPETINSVPISSKNKRFSSREFKLPG
ncbi:MAG: GHKL domain-containing protein [Syntrophomonas sp.]